MYRVFDHDVDALYSKELALLSRPDTSAKQKAR